MGDTKPFMILIILVETDSETEFTDFSPFSKKC